MRLRLNQRKLQSGHHLVARRAQPPGSGPREHGDDNKIVAIFKTRLLKVADGMGFFNEASVFPKYVSCRGLNQRLDLACLTIEPE